MRTAKSYVTPASAAYIILTLCITLILQMWVGGASLYSDALSLKQEDVFPQLLKNMPNPGVNFPSAGLTLWL